MNVTQEGEQAQEADHALPGRPVPRMEALMVYVDALLEAKRNLHTAIAVVVATITDKETRQRVALSMADMLGWGDSEFNRPVFLACCGVEDRAPSPYFTLVEEF